MTAQADIERLLDGWLAGGPAAMPGGFLGSVADAIAGQPQRVVWRVRGNRVPARSFGAFAIAAAALALVAVIGFNLIPRLPAINASPNPSAVPASPTPTPTPTSQPTRPPLVSPTPEFSLDPLPPPLAPGTYTSTRFWPELTFTVPDGWTLENDTIDSLVLVSIADPFDNIEFVRNVYPPDVTPTCQAQRDRETPHSAQDFIDFMESRPDWSGAAEPLVLGGLDGWLLDGFIDESGCMFRYTRLSPEGFSGSVVGTGQWSAYILDDGKGSNIVMEMRGDSAFIARAESVIATFAFDLPGQPCESSQPIAGSPAPTASAAGQLQLESAFWPDADGNYRYVVVATNNGPAANGRIDVRMVDACGEVFEDSVPIVLGMRRDDTLAVVRDVKEGFIPIRMQVTAKMNILRELPGILGTCSRLADGEDDDGVPIVRGQFEFRYLIDVFFEAAAVYRDPSGSIVGADGGSMTHQWSTPGVKTFFEFPRSNEVPADVSTEFFCFVRAAAP